MSTTLLANANPEKRLFISLLTRDIPLVAAFLDLVDNSINAAVEPHSKSLKTSRDYVAIYENQKQKPTVSIHLKISPEAVAITDNAIGISAATAEEHVFKFGRAIDEEHASDRLSVYGIGLKRALFKLGNHIRMQSDHRDGGFDLDIKVDDWANNKAIPWTFAITTREAVLASATGTRIQVEELYEETRRRIGDGVFINQLKDAISKTYAFYLAKFVRIYVNEQEIFGTEVELGTNRTQENFSSNEVTWSISAGIGIPQAGGFRDRTAGWFVFCNGRAVVSADKTPLTGWALGASGLPIFQPKHRAFTGIVFFVSPKAEKLPWNTTKSGVNEDSAVWQEAKRQMIAAGRQVISFLDSRYSEEGTEVSQQELQLAAGKTVNAIAGSISAKSTFKAPSRPKPTTLKVQYDANLEDVKRVAKHLGRSTMSGSEVGRLTFEHFVRNELGDK